MSNYYTETPFDDLLHDIVRKRNIQAIMALEGILYKIQRSNNGDDLLKYIFATALLKFLGHSTSSYIHSSLDLRETNYHKTPKKYQDRAFKKFELHDLIARTSNQIIVDTCKKNTILTLFNIGHLNHIQVQHLFNLIEQSKTAIKHIKFLDFLALPLKEIQKNQALLQQYAPTIKLEYFSNQKDITQINKQEWNILHTIYGEEIVIYCPYQSQFSIEKQFISFHLNVNILRELREFKPLLFLLTASNSNLGEVNFIRRFHIAWNHMPYVFEYIQNLDIQPFEKTVLKVRYQKIIEDIIANNNYKIGALSHFRTPSYWVERLSIIGFKIPNTSLIPISELPKHKLLHFNFYDGYLGIDFKDQNFVGLVVVTY